MHRLLSIWTTVLFLYLAVPAQAQILVTEENYPVTEQTVRQPWDDNIAIHADPRLALLVDKHRNSQYGGTRHMRGYRVQIYYGIDRNVAFQRKADFMRRYPSIKVYMTYTQPQYRVKVGDFATREDAIDLYRETMNLYGACMMVPDNVIITSNPQKDD